MDNNLRIRIRNALETRNQISFQQLVNKIFVYKYKKDFTPVKPKWDKGSDGILFNNTILAVYAPTPRIKNIYNEFENKVRSDFQSYEKNWKASHPNWKFIYNGEYTAKMINLLDKLCSYVEKCDINHIMRIIEGLKFAEYREIAQYLGISVEFISNDIIKQIIDDMIKVSIKLDKTLIRLKNPSDILEKIKKNYRLSKIEVIRKEHELFHNDIANLGRVLKAYDSMEISALKNRLYFIFSKLEGDFNEKFNNLYELITEDYIDDVSKHWVRVLLLYYFQDCLLGDAP